MMDERQMALPKLYGAPSYRPPKPVDESSRPFDPDELPISAYRSEDEVELVQSLPAEARRRVLGRLFGRD